MSAFLAHFNAVQGICDSQILDRAQFVFYTVPMTQVSHDGDIFLSECANIRIIPRHLAFSRREEPAQNA
jgi:hypothetical protein